jgi:hypothetical protein
MSEPRITIAQADEFCRFHSTRETKSCRECARQAYSAYAFKLSKPNRGHGWELESEYDQPSWLLRCYECRGVCEHAWLAKADRERVQAWLQEQSDANHGEPFVIDFDGLKRSLGFGA